MNKKVSVLLISLGIIVMICAASLVGYNVYVQYEADTSANSLVDELHDLIPDEPNKFDSSSENILRLNGEEYLGIIDIPRLKISLPVTSTWDYDKMYKAACRYYGSVDESNLIIAAHNYSSYFNNLDSLYADDEIVFTECSGVVHKYKVTSVQIVGGYDSPSLFTEEKNWDIELFTCTWSGYSRIVVRGTEIK
ncbi:MAG: sortase [Oscillospiraceae bacterium]